MPEIGIQFRLEFTGTGTGTAISSNPSGLTGSSPGPTPYTALSFNTPGPYTVQFTAIPDPGSIFVGWTAVNDNGFPPPISPGVSVNNPETFTHNNPDETYTITAQFNIAPCPTITLQDSGPFSIFLNELMVPVTLVPVGGTAPYTFSIDPNWDDCPDGLCPGATLPPGLTIGASTGIISGTPTAGSSCTYVAVLITDANQCQSRACIQITVGERPLPTCYELTHCPTGVEPAPIVVTNDMSLYVGPNIVIQILGQCFTVQPVTPCPVNPITLVNLVITVFEDCCSCNPSKIYTLIDCSLQTPQIITSTDLSQYADQTIKVCNFNATVGVAIDPLVGPCPGFEKFVTQVTGNTTGFYFDPLGPGIFPYDNPAAFPVVPGQAICVNILNVPADITAVGTPDVYSVQYFMGTTPLTNLITITPEMDLISAQYFVDQQIIYTNTTITVTAFSPSPIGFTVDVNIQSPIDGDLIAVLTSNPSVFIPVPVTTSPFSGSCICYTVVESTSCLGPFPPFTGIVSGAFPDCICCDPPPTEPEPPYIPTPPEIDKKTYFISETQCDIDANKTFANAMFDIFKTEAYGMESCCPRNFDQIWIQKELSDLSKTKC